MKKKKNNIFSIQITIYTYRANRKSAFHFKKLKLKVLIFLSENNFYNLCR